MRVTLFLFFCVRVCSRMATSNAACISPTSDIFYVPAQVCSFRALKRSGSLRSQNEQFQWFGIGVVVVVVIIITVIIKRSTTKRKNEQQPSTWASTAFRCWYGCARFDTASRVVPFVPPTHLIIAAFAERYVVLAQSWRRSILLQVKRERERVRDERTASIVTVVCVTLFRCLRFSWLIV